MHMFGELWELQEASLFLPEPEVFNSPFEYQFNETEEDCEGKKRKKKRKRKRSDNEEEIKEKIIIYSGNEGNYEIDCKSESDTFSMISTEDLLNSKGNHFEKELKDFDNRLKKASCIKKSSRVHLNLTPDWINRIRMMIK